LGILLAALCLIPAFSSSVSAYPKPYQDTGDNPPGGPRGDGDGTVVKGARMDGIAIDTSRASGSWKTYSSALQRYIRLVRMGYGLRWYW